MEDTKCLVCGDDHRDGGNLPCTNYTWMRSWDKAMEGGDYTASCTVELDSKGNIISVRGVLNETNS